MFILFLLIIAAMALVFSFHRIVMKAVEDYNYGGGSFAEWREFEAMHRRVLD
jgi:hypothetical protein